MLTVLPVCASDLLVTNTADSGDGSLHQAIQTNTALGGGNRILFAGDLAGAGPRMVTSRLSTSSPLVSEMVTVNARLRTFDKMTGLPDGALI